MKNVRNKLIVLLFMVITLPHPGSAQDSIANEPEYEVNRIYPHITITKEKLIGANTLIDLNNEANDLHLYYKTSWIREYISVEILTSQNGKIRKALSKNDILSQEQKDNMKLADSGTNISVKVKYIPENTLTQNDPKELDFTFTVNPEREAKFPGGQQQLKKYLKENAIDKIPHDSFRNYDLTAIKFTVSEEGEIISAHVFESVYQTYKNEKVDQLLLKTIRNMPCWEPAEYPNGTKVKQEFVFTVGNHQNCLIPLLNIRKLLVAKND